MKNLAVNTQTLFTKIQNLYMQSPLAIGLLVIIAIATAGSGFLGFKLGDEALKGVSQPEINPSQKLLDKPTKSEVQTDKAMTVFKPVNETKVINQVKAHIGNPDGKNKSPNKASKSSQVATKDNKVKVENKANPSKPNAAQTKPDSSKSQSSQPKN